MKSIPLLLALMLSSLCFADGTPVHYATFTINGNQTIQLPVTDNGPAPAQSGDVTMVVAGPLFGVSKTRKGESDVVWAFALACPQAAVYQKVTVENVSGSAPQLVVAVNNPKPELVNANGFNGFLVRAHSGATPINPQTEPWLYADGNTTLVFRVTLVTDKGASIVLYQPTLYGAAQKKQIVAQVQQVANGAVSAPAPSARPVP